MEGSVGFFSQFKYVIKGIVKPKYFNRLCNQSKPAFIIYTILMAIVSAAVYWGIIYLFAISPNGFLSQVKSTIQEENVPKFTYVDGSVTFAEKKHYGEDGTYYIFDSTVNNADKEYIDKAEITVDWSNGVQVFIFNAQSMTQIRQFGGTNTIKYADVADMLSLPNKFDREGLVRILQEKFLIGFLIVAGISVIGFIFKAFITGVIFGFVGFGIAKIVKLPWPYIELYKVALYVTGYTTIIKSALQALPIHISPVFLAVLFLIIGGVYMFFAITGSTEDAGPTSTVVFNKPGTQKSFGEIEPPDPFARRTSYAPSSSATTGTQFSAKAVTEAPSYSSQASTASATQATASSLFTPKSSAETSYTAAQTESVSYEAQPETVSYEAKPSYEQPVYETQDNTVYEETQTVYEETQAYDDTQYVQTEEVAYEAAPEVTYEAQAEVSNEAPVEEEKPAIIKSDLTTFGSTLNASSGPTKKKEKWARPITAPDAYNGLYYSGSDSEESYESNYGTGSLQDRGGMYGKTIGGTSSDNPFAGVLSGARPQPAAASTFGSSLGYHATNNDSVSAGAVGGSLFHKDAPQHEEPTSHLSFTTKSGNSLGNNNSYLSAPPSPDYKKGSNTIKKGGKTVNRYSADDFAAWERENYAEEFKPRGGFGNNIF